jgi:hypothetical protein
LALDILLLLLLLPPHLLFLLLLPQLSRGNGWLLRDRW